MSPDSADEATLHFQACLTGTTQGVRLQMLSMPTVHLKLEYFYLPSTCRKSGCPVRCDAMESCSDDEEGLPDGLPYAHNP
jgi:hypothetical protein